jgi:CheY-like chemotaxis protein
LVVNHSVLAVRHCTRRGRPCSGLGASPDSPLILLSAGSTGATLVAVTATVLIVDDHAAFREAAREVLEKAGFVVVGEAGDATEALESARQLLPDVVLLDVLLPDRDGFAVAEELATLNPAIAVVLVSTREESDYRRRLEATTARGFISKAELTGELLSRRLGTG